MFNGRASRHVRAEAAAAGAQGGSGGERKPNKDAAGPRPPLRKLPPVPTFAGGPKAGGGGAFTDPGLIAAGKANGQLTEKAAKTSDAMSLLLDEYEEDDS